jgi:hypothetical protein
MCWGLALYISEFFLCCIFSSGVDDILGSRRSSTCVLCQRICLSATERYMT